MPEVRLHIRNGENMIKFLCENKRDFVIEKTSAGFPTIIFDGKRMYVRPNKQNYGSLNRIISFQNKVSSSDLAEFLQDMPEKEIERESLSIEKTIIYKGFNFDPKKEDSFSKVIKIDLNSAYWQTCRFMELIDKELYRRVSDGCLKSTRLMMTGTLGKKVIITEYKDGKRVKSYVKEVDAKRLIQQNIYNRIRKFVDELMIWAWKRDPLNFIGYYVDCIWFRHPDHELFELLNSIYKIKMEIVDLNINSKPKNFKKLMYII